MICKRGVKVSFLTEAQARARADQLGLKKVYKCPKCRQWHMTKGKKKRHWWKQQKSLREAIMMWNEKGATKNDQ